MLLLRVHGKALITVCDLIECKEGFRLEFMTKCCACGKNVDMREVEDGGDPDGSELSNGRWVCSGECWDTVVEREEREQKYRDIIIELSRCLVGMTPGGSEYMKRFDDNLYYADVKICEEVIRNRFETATKKKRK